MGISVTNLIRKVFGYSATAPYIQNPIPDTTALAARASFELGFPPATMTEKVAGGIPPYGQDVNGILAMITNNLAGLNAGQINVYDATFASDIGGYKKGATLGMADGTGWWINLTDGNTTDPDASGAGWAPAYRYDWSNITGLVGGTRTLTQVEASSRVLVLTGVLGSNQIIVLPADLREWLVINGTTGAFTLTCKTASGTGITVPNGGAANATQIFGDGTNIYYAAATTSIPVDQGAMPSTIAERTGTGSLVATKFDDLTALVNTFGPRSLAANGYYTLPGGLIVNWGSYQFGDLVSGLYANAVTQTFSKPFTTAVFQIFTGKKGYGTVAVSGARNITLTGFQLYMEEWAGITQGADNSATWLAIGI